MFSESTLAKRMQHVQYAIRELFPVAERIERSGGKITKVNVGDPVPYFGTPKYILEALEKAAREGKTGYGRSPGEMFFLEAIARRYKRMYRLDVGPDDIFVTQGVSEAIQFLDACLLEDGKGCVMFSPYYPAYIPQLRIFGGQSYIAGCVEEEGWAPNQEEVEKQISKASAEGTDLKYIHLINPCNPTGAVWKRKELEWIARIARENDFLIISDEIYDEIVFRGDFVSMAEVARDQPLVLLNGLSKNWCATGLRIGWIVLSGDGAGMQSLRDGLSRIATVRLCPSMPAQYAGAEALDNVKAHKEFLSKFNREVKKRSDYCWKRLNEIDGVSCQRASSAFYLFPKIDLKRSGCKTSAEFVRKLLEKEKVWAVQGSGFGSESHIRIVTLPAFDVLENACTGIERMLKA